MTTLSIGSLAALAALVACGTTGSAKLAEHEAREKLGARNLEVFDDLDYNVFSNQKWTELHKSHGKDIVVHWPDGHTTTGIDVHIKDLAAMFVYAPDTRIKEHPIRITSGEWTAVTGVMEGTFTRPMPMPDGTSTRTTPDRESRRWCRSRPRGL